MRKDFWNWWIENAEKEDLFFIFNDLWRFPVPVHLKDRVIDLGTQEDSTWNFAAGCARAHKKVFVYSVSFFGIGRLESLRSEITIPNLDIFILNAGLVGYDIYGEEHSFKNNDDIKVMEAIGIEVIEPLNFNDKKTQTSLKDFCASGGQYYYRLQKD